MCELWRVLIVIAALVPSVGKAEFIANAFGGRAKELTRAAASAAFHGYEAFYSGMASLEVRDIRQAREAFIRASKSADEAVTLFHEASKSIETKRVNLDRVTDIERAILTQFLTKIGLRFTGDTTNADILLAYSTSYKENSRFLRQAVERGLNISSFREIQAFLDRQIAAGTVITNLLRN